MKLYSSVRAYAIPALYLTTLLGLILFAINRDFPKVGHDYGFFIPRMLDTHLHHKVNGFTIQWYTANFGAGTPAYANPQYIQYSLPQFAMLAINPWLALMSSLIAYALIGFACFYLFLTDDMAWTGTASALGASFILANGFFVEHAIVGHVGFQHFPLLGAILFLAFTKKLGFLPAGLLIGLLTAMIVNQAGFIILIIFILSSLMIIPLIYLVRPDLFTRKLFAALLTGGLFAALLSLSKISAVMAFMRFFPRVIEDYYGQTYLQGILGMIRQLAGFNFILPYYLITGRNQEDITSFFQQGAGAEFGIWETNIFLSPALLFLLVLGLGYVLFSGLRSKPRISPGKLIATLVLGLAVWLSVDLTLAQGGLYNLVKPLPVLRSLHANLRFTSAFVFPLAFLGAYIFHQVFKDRKPANLVAFFLQAAFTIGVLSMYLFIPDQVQNRSFNLQSTLPTYTRIDHGWNFTLKNVAEITDMEVFQQEDSNLASQDPMFGYQGEFFKPKVVVGPILELQDGHFNMTHPASYVFPEQNNLQPFDLFREDQKADLELFINHKQPALEISSWQKAADFMSFTALVVSIGSLFFLALKGSARVWQMNAR